MIAAASAVPLAAQVVVAPAAGGFPTAQGHGILGEQAGLSEASSPYTPLSLPCSINVACPEGDAWDDVARSVVKISTGCTGVLVNNTRRDQQPYVLTAYHCSYPALGDTLDWTFAFSYQSSTCADPTETPVPLTLQGAVVRAVYGGYADFALLELLEPIPLTYEAVYAGWSIEAALPASGAVIGHPRQDIKKITLEDDPIADLAGIFWDATFDRGTIEVGSSGAPLFDAQRRLIGLTRSAITIDHYACSGPGGDDNNVRILFPKLGYNWILGTPGARLADVLDPDATGATTLDALEPSPVWINEVNADAHRKARREHDEFVELVGLAGTRLDGYTLGIYACKNGTTTHLGTQALAPFTFPDHRDGLGFFVLGGPGVEPEVRNQTFEPPSYSRVTDLLPDGSGLLILYDAAGTERFDYQYDGGKRFQCPADRTMRSAGDEPGTQTMGFAGQTIPTPATAGTPSLRATPGKPNLPGTPKRTLAATPEAAAAYQFDAAYPNPFNPQTQIRLSVAQTQQVEVAVYNAVGRRVALLYDGLWEAQTTRTFAFDAARLPSGVYLIRAVGQHFITSQPVTLVR